MRHGGCKEQDMIILKSNTKKLITINFTYLLNMYMILSHTIHIMNFTCLKYSKLINGIIHSISIIFINNISNMIKLSKLNLIKYYQIPNPKPKSSGNSPPKNSTSMTQIIIIIILYPMTVYIIYSYIKIYIHINLE